MMNDEMITPVEESEVVNANAYVLVYRRQTSSQTEKSKSITKNALATALPTSLATPAGIASANTSLHKHYNAYSSVQNTSNPSSVMIQGFIGISTSGSEKREIMRKFQGKEGSRSSGFFGGMTEKKELVPTIVISPVDDEEDHVVETFSR